MSIIIDSINIVFEKDFWGGVLSSVAIAVSATALWSTIKKWREPKTLAQIVKEMEKDIRKIRKEYEEQKENLSKSEQLEAEEKLSKYESLIQDYYDGTLSKRSSNKQSGFMSHDFLLYAVPAIIALTFTFTLVYLLVANQAVENYQSPEVLKSGLSTIIGYYFGVAVKNSPPQDPDKRLDELQKQLNNVLKN
ncbi:hypothetical protein [Vibrio crassostreae]|uniref:hypothetical protein n=1 Tax=Vibrio crassostreae TaxID=246167 RepID=UPI000378A1D4|nr:hypothetical protein [Vibrio crassostreae]OED85093.1 hypothetical protein A141_01395 [Vibrio crassostreae ZF-91]